MRERQVGAEAIVGKRHRTEGAGHAVARHQPDAEREPAMAPGRVRGGGLSSGMSVPTALASAGHCAASLRTSHRLESRCCYWEFYDMRFKPPTGAVSGKARVSVIVPPGALSALARAEQALAAVKPLVADVESDAVRSQWDRAIAERAELAPQVAELLAVQDRLATPAGLAKVA